MTRFVPAAQFLLALVYIAVNAPSARAQELASTATSAQVQISYETPSDARFRPIYEGLKHRQVLERLQRFLRPLRLPQVLTVKLTQCGAETKPYKSGGPVAICYELIERIIDVTTQNTKDANEQTLITDGTFVEAVLHEVAHAVFDLLQVPIWGREDDAADRSRRINYDAVLGPDRFHYHHRHCEIFRIFQACLDRCRLRRLGIAGSAAILQLPLHRLWRRPANVPVLGAAAGPKPSGQTERTSRTALRGRVPTSSARLRSTHHALR